MKKYMIRCDMEGVGGIVNEEQASPHGAEYAEGRAWFMAELVALVSGLQAGGAEEVVVYDEHYYGRNVDLSRIPSGTQVICGKPPYRSDWAGGLDSSVDGLILHGFHSKAGTPDGLLNHSYEPEITNLVLNGISVGEIGMEAAIAGDFGVPVVMIVADSAGVAEAEALLPGIMGVSVKKSISENGAICYALPTNLARITSAATGVVKDPPSVKPYALGTKVRLTVELNAGPYLEAIRELYRPLLIDSHTLELRGDTTTEIWAEYWQMKLKSQKRVAANK